MDEAGGERREASSEAVLACELHDGFLQDVVGAHMLLQALLDRVAAGPGCLREDLRRVDELLVRAIADARRLIRDLQLPAGGGADLLAAIRDLIDAEGRAGGLAIALDCPSPVPRLPPLVAGCVWRIVQESLRNIRRHARTDRALVRILCEADAVRVEVQDEGIGFDPQEIPASCFGLRSISARAGACGGEAAIDSLPGQGTRIRARFPLPASTEPPHV